MFKASRNTSELQALIRRRTRVVGDCWEWQGARVQGYGVTGIPRERRNARAHRVAYVAFVGPIPDGLVLDHLCRNPACCNPAHLEPVTDRVNTLRGESPNILVMHSGVCRRGHARSPENLTKDRACRQCKRERARSRAS